MLTPTISIEIFIDMISEGNMYPIRKYWKHFTIEHTGMKLDKSAENALYAHIKNEVGENSGIYCYFNENDECLYVGKGKPLFNRIKSHYFSSFIDKRYPGKAHIWNVFFNIHLGKLTVYYLEINGSDENSEHLRVIVERLVTAAEKPFFVSKNNDYKLIMNSNPKPI